MDEASKLKLESILRKDMSEITEEDMVYLKARRFYLRSHQLKRYGIELEGDKGKKNKVEGKRKDPEPKAPPTVDNNQDNQQDSKNPEVTTPANPEGKQVANTDDYSGGDADPDNPQG